MTLALVEAVKNTKTVVEKIYNIIHKFLDNVFQKEYFERGGNTALSLLFFISHYSEILY